MFQLQCEQGIVEGRNGVCFSYRNKPTISIMIRSDITNCWIQGDDFLLDSGAAHTVLHSDEAVKLKLDINQVDSGGFFIGACGIKWPIFYKKGMLVKVGNFPAVPLTIGFSPHLAAGIRILGRRTIFELFGIVFSGKEIGVFAK